MAFDRHAVVAEASRRYQKGVSVDALDDAVNAATFDEAVMTVLLDTVMWDSPTGNPMDEEIWKNILPPATM